MASIIASSFGGLNRCTFVQECGASLQTDDNLLIMPKNGVTTRRTGPEPKFPGPFVSDQSIR